MSLKGLVSQKGSTDHLLLLQKLVSSQWFSKWPFIHYDEAKACVQLSYEVYSSQLAYFGCPQSAFNFVFIIMLKGVRYSLIIHEVWVVCCFFPAGVQDETLKEESQRLASL